MTNAIAPPDACLIVASFGTGYMEIHRPSCPSNPGAPTAIQMETVAIVMVVLG
jgi:hypothetical protein